MKKNKTASKIRDFYEKNYFLSKMLLENAIYILLFIKIKYE